MKKIKLFAFSILVALVMTTNVNAQEVSSSSELLDCIAVDGNTCTLAKDIDLEERLVLDSGKTIVLDLNGKTLNVKHIIEENWSVFVKGNLTIQGNGTMNITNIYGIAVTGTLTVKNGTFNQTDGDYIISSWGTTTIENGTFNGDYCVVNSLGGTTVIKNGIFNTKPHAKYDGEDETLYYWGVLVDEPNGAKLEVQKGTFNQILSWPNVLADNAEVTYNLEAENVLYDPVEIKGNVTLNLNGQKVSFNESDIEDGEDSLFTILRGGKLTINDSEGTGIITNGTTDKIYAAVKLTKKGETENGDVAELVVNGGTLQGYYYAITGNGSRHDTIITVNDGVLKSLSGIMGIYHPQSGVLNINGGTITGKTGIEMRAGKLNVTDGTITGTAAPTSSNPNGSGSTSLGAGIAIAQHTTKLNLDVTISGGTIKGYSAIYETDPEENNQPEQINISITGGKFEAINNGTLSVYSENNRATIKGGTFTNDVKDYVATGYVSKKVGDNYNVGKENKVNITTPENGTVAANKTTAVVGETVTITTNPNEGYKVSIVKVVDENNEEIEVTENTFVMPNSAVTITVSYVKTSTTVELPVLDTEEEPEEVIVGVKEEIETENVLLESLEADEELAEIVKNENVTVGVEISGIDTEKLPEETKTVIQKAADKLTIAEYFDVSVVVRNSDDFTEIDTISELTKEIELMILLPEKLKNSDKEVNRKYYVIREHDGVAKKIEAKLSEDGKYLTFKSKQFSTYALAYEDVALENVNSPQTGDNFIINITMVIIALIAFMGSVLVIKKRFN